MTQVNTSLPPMRLFAFGLVNLPLSMLMSPTAAVLPNFYLEYSAVTLAGLSTATLLARVFDGLTDPLVGYLSDRSGRRKPWMIAGALLVAAAAWFLYNPSRESGVAHLLGWYLVATLGWTLVEIPHTAMAAELSGDYHERSRIALWRQMLGFAGGVLFMASPMLLATSGSKFTPEVMRVIALFVMLALPLAVLVLCRAVPEPVRRVQSRPLRFNDLYRALVETRPLRYFLLTQVLFGLATGAVSSLFVIYASRYLGLADKVPHIALPMTLAMALGMPVWLRVMRRMEKHRAWSIAAAGMMAALLAVTVLEPGPGALRPMIAIMAVFGFFLGCSSIALPSLLADVVDYDVWRNRQDRAAILFSFQAVVTKLNQGVGGAVALAIPVWFGFSQQEPASKAAELGLKAAFIGWPCVLLVPMLVLAWRYPLGRRSHGILARRLARRRDAGGSAAHGQPVNLDPVDARRADEPA
jgi:Na+/melibiose symporter-like transporter